MDRKQWHQWFSLEPFVRFEPRADEADDSMSSIPTEIRVNLNEAFSDPSRNPDHVIAGGEIFESLMDRSPQLAYQGSSSEDEKDGEVMRSPPAKKRRLGTPKTADTTKYNGESSSSSDEESDDDDENYVQEYTASGSPCY